MINQLFGRYLVNTGYLEPEQLYRALDTQNKVRVKMGLIAVTEKLMTIEQAEEVNRLQAVMDKRFGDIAIEKGYLTDEQVNRLLGLQGNRYLTFAQAVTDNGFMTLKEIDNAFAEYQRSLGFTATDMDALKSGDSDRIVPLFVPYDCSEEQEEHILVAVRTLLRLIDSDAYIGQAEWITSVSCSGAALQQISGDARFVLGITGNRDAVLSVADAFAHDEFDDLDLDALDSVAEFINCINGMFATGISNKLKVDMLPPVYKDKEVVLTGNTEGILKFPMYINGKELLLLFAYEGSINMD